jgi:type IV secretion system protein VirB10
MKKRLLTLFVALLIAAVAPVAESIALAAQRKTCNCKPTLRRRTAKRPVRAVRAKATTAKTAAAVVGPVVATYTLPENQVFTLRMNDPLTSKTARIGDRFRTTVMVPVYASGVEVVPAGSIVEGRVTAVSPARSRGRAGSIAVSFDNLVLPDGTRHKIEGDLTDVQGGESEVDNESSVSGRSSETRQVVFVGGGGVVGAVLGGVMGGGKGAGIGAAVGAGAGVAGAMLSKGKEAEVRRGTEISMMTTRPVTFTVEKQ